MTYTEKIEYLVGNSKFDIKPDEPYNKNVCQFISDLSKNLINNLEAKKYPDILTFAFWCREKNILKFKSKLDSNNSRLGLGLLFHVTPSNIPTNFAYSLIFGLTTGNSNIIKVPTNQFRQTQIICRVIKQPFWLKLGRTLLEAKVG